MKKVDDLEVVEEEGENGRRSKQVHITEEQARDQFQGVGNSPVHHGGLPESDIFDYIDRIEPQLVEKFNMPYSDAEFFRALEEMPNEGAADSMGLVMRMLTYLAKENQLRVLEIINKDIFDKGTLG